MREREYMVIMMVRVKKWELSMVVMVIGMEDRMGFVFVVVGKMILFFFSLKFKILY